MDKTFFKLKKRMEENLEFSKSPNIFFSKKFFLWIKFHPYRFYLLISSGILIAFILLKIDIINLVSLLQFGL
jgi:hypothetical protein